jgi:hypothetical protein
MSDINIKSSTIEKGLDLLKGFLDKAIGPTAEEFGLAMSDNLKMRRLKNQLKNLEKAKKIAEEHNIRIKQINLKALFPYLEGVALEEDENLQDMWANLFVNYIDSDRNLTMTVFPDILKHLSSNEVKMLTFMNGNSGRIKKSHWNKETIDFPSEYTLEEMGNLARLGLIREESNFSLYDGDKIEELKPENYYLTELGEALLKACKR